MADDDKLVLPVIDAHVHLYPEAETASLAWCAADAAFAGQHSVDEYRRAAPSAPSLLGFVVVEADRPHDLTVYNVTSDPSFAAWRTAMYALSKASRTYVKLSGALAEMSDTLRAQPAPLMLQSLLPWFGVLLATFGPSRLLFGSDWPVCTAGGLGDDAWPKWRDVVERMCWMATLDDARAMIFGGTAKQAYGLRGGARETAAMASGARRRGPGRTFSAPCFVHGEGLTAWRWPRPPPQECIESIKAQQASRSRAGKHPP